MSGFDHSDDRHREAVEIVEEQRKGIIATGLTIPAQIGVAALIG
jgi:hypothetical protein